MTGAVYDPTEICDMSARFLTRPQAWPSGVSAGQTIPQCVLCNCRGFVALLPRSMGVFVRRK